MKCETCGEEFKPKNSGQKYCSRECGHKAVSQSYELARIQKAANEATARALAKAIHKRTLADWEREAADCNMDYGTYRAQIEVFGKTYEELKATADRRQVPKHAHGHRGIGHLG